jgi:acyl-[acyl-carrier-protein]-phospholipid O-acyltransferase/long-chain-fatty-acid--[acyl-carrier-protein] ligase
MTRLAAAVVRAGIRRCVLFALRVRTSYRKETLQALSLGPTIVCSNHVSLIDGVIVALTSPIPLTFGVDTDFSVRTKLTRNGMAALAWLGFGSVVPIDSTSPYGIRALAKALDRGESVMIFPEGRISDNGQPGDDQPGVEWLARRSGARVRRIRIAGAENSRLFAKSGRHLWPRVQIFF